MSAHTMAADLASSGVDAPAPLMAEHLDLAYDQRQIVTDLDQKTQEIDASIETEEKKIEHLKEYRQSLISNVVTGKIDITISGKNAFGRCL